MEGSGMGFKINTQKKEIISHEKGTKLRKQKKINLGYRAYYDLQNSTKQKSWHKNKNKDI